jgi:hypothetical protein
MNNTPFSLRIFVADGDPDGLRIIERSNWTGRAIVFPRALFPEVRDRDEFQQTGVYILIGPKPDSDGDKIYIGEGDPVRQRLESHYATKDFWTHAVFFVAGPGHLNKAHIQYLESKLVARAAEAKRMSLDNGNKPAEPTLSEADRADMEVFLQNILGMLPVLGIDAFEKSAGRVISKDNPILHCSGRGVKATGQETSRGFVVFAGSEAAIEHTPSLVEWSPSIGAWRKEYIENGLLEIRGDKLVFKQDFTFSSPSYASSVVLARSSNGRADWKDENGKSLKEIQEARLLDPNRS